MDERTCIADLWSPIPGYEGYYEVSTAGQVRSVDRVVTCKNGRLRRYRGRLLAQSLSQDGRPSVNLYGSNGNRTWRVCQLVLMTFVGERPPGMEACHDNGDDADNMSINLRWGTKSQNMLDKVRHGHCQYRNRTVCPLDHPLKSPNLVACREKQGHRVCLACARARANQQDAKRSGCPFDLRAAADRHYQRIMS